MNRHLHYSTRCVALTAAMIFAIYCSQPVAQASTVADMPMTEIADHAGQVFECVVTSTRSYWANDPEVPRRIETEITFANVKYWKGRHPGAGNTFTLVVPGGTVGETQMRICCTPEFNVGQRWVLCLLPQYKTYPVVGLWQGAFEVRHDADGTPRVYQAGSLAVTGFDESGHVVGAASRSADPRANLVHAEHVRIRPLHAEARTDAMSLDEFEATLQPLLQSSRNHRMKRAAAAGEVHEDKLETRARHDTVAAKQQSFTRFILSAVRCARFESSIIATSPDRPRRSGQCG